MRRGAGPNDSGFCYLLLPRAMVIVFCNRSVNLLSAEPKTDLAAFSLHVVANMVA